MIPRLKTLVLRLLAGYKIQKIENVDIKRLFFISPQTQLSQEVKPRCEGAIFTGNEKPIYLDLFLLAKGLYEMID